MMDSYGCKNLTDRIITAAATCCFGGAAVRRAHIADIHGRRKAAALCTVIIRIPHFGHGGRGAIGESIPKI
jgi:hypothetical protein